MRRLEYDNKRQSHFIIDDRGKRVYFSSRQLAEVYIGNLHKNDDYVRPPKYGERTHRVLVEQKTTPFPADTDWWAIAGNPRSPRREVALFKTWKESHHLVYETRLGETAWSVQDWAAEVNLSENSAVSFNERFGRVFGRKLPERKETGSSSSQRAIRVANKIATLPSRMAASRVD